MPLPDLKGLQQLQKVTEQSTLHNVGHVHRDITKDDVLLKRVNEGVVVKMIKMIDLGYCAKIDPPTKCMYISMNMSLHVLKTCLYTTYDDLISALHLMIELSGTEPFDLKLPLLQGKEKVHNHPSTCLDETPLMRLPAMLTLPA